MGAPMTMAAKVEDYVQYRRGLGYQLKTAGTELKRFARYADSIGHQGALTVELALRWARAATNSTSLYQARRLEMVRGLARYLKALQPATQIPPRGLLGRAHRRVQPYIYTEEQIANLIQAARELNPSASLRPHTYATLLGLLAATGLRVGEALQLGREDLDHDGHLLIVRQGKFHKSRVVPLHPSTTDALVKYCALRDGHAAHLTTSRLLVSAQGRALLPSVVHYTFRTLRDRLVWDKGRRPPRLYDLRHTFVCRRILAWYRSGVDVNHAISHLSTYVGHVKVSDTYWYLSGIPELLRVVGDRFERYACPERGQG